MSQTRSHPSAIHSSLASDPELGELVPDRTTLGMPGSPVSIAEYVTASARMAGAQLCDHCGGAGSDEASDCSECSGLGWLLNRPAAE